MLAHMYQNLILKNPKAILALLIVTILFMIVDEIFCYNSHFI